MNDNRPGDPQPDEQGLGENILELRQDNILYVTLVGVLDEKIATSIIQALPGFYNTVPWKVGCLIDFSKSGEISTEAKKLFINLAKDGKIGKVAVIGLGFLARAAAWVFIRTLPKKEISIFKTEGEALSWLNKNIYFSPK